MNSPIKHSLVFQANDAYRNYLLHTYIVTSKPKRISVADGVVHITNLLSFRFNVIILLQSIIYNNEELVYDK